MNPKCKEVLDAIRLSSPEGSHETAAQRTDIVQRVFNLQKDDLIDNIVNKSVLGKVIAHCHTIEWQKRGLPHFHALFIMSNDWRIKTSEDVDSAQWARIPEDCEEFAELRRRVIEHMIHGPCSIEYGSPCCQKTGKCSKGYPKPFSERSSIGSDGYAVPRRPNDGQHVKKIAANGKEVFADNRWVVPFNPWILRYLDSHSNLEITHHIQCVKYIYKYVFKGNARVLIKFKVITKDGKEIHEEVDEVHDEVTEFLNCRYMCAHEGVAYILSHKLHAMYPSVIGLNLHLPHKQNIYFKDKETLKKKSAKEDDTMLTAWFKFNKKNEDSRKYLYAEFPEHYTFDNKQKSWRVRAKGVKPTIGRLYVCFPKHGDLFYLRLLLLHIKGATSFEYLLTDDEGNVHETFKDCAKARGLATDDKQYIECLQEAKESQMPYQLRKLYATIISRDFPSDPWQLFKQFQYDLCEDIVYQVCLFI